MRIRIIGRHDPVLFAGLTLALLVVFQRSIQHTLDAARSIEQTYGVALTPALLILTVMFVFHEYAKRRESKAEAAAAGVEAALARARVQEMERLVLFGQELSRSLSADGLREAIWRHLPLLPGGEAAWVVLRAESGWARVSDCAHSRWPADEIERIADRAALDPPAEHGGLDGIECDGHVCFVMRSGTLPIGVVGLAPQPRGHYGRETLGAAAALLAIAVRNTQLFADVRDLSVKDGLTDCFNRTHAFEILESELARSRRTGAPLSVVLFDVDRFKDINDRYGHPCGDAVLAAVGQRMRQVLRRSDVRCRYGGDEFLVVLPETPASGAARVAEWLRSELENIDVTVAGGPVPITISAGVATVVGGDCTPTTIIELADQALYRAKEAGRNCARCVDVAAQPQGLMLPVGVTTH